jgi:anaerobic magnesium-protoporphyrin IX monomethyl ester cyclase
VFTADLLLLRPKGRSTDSRLFAMEQLGLGYIAAYARARGFLAEILDGFLEPDRYRERLETLHTGDYHLIGYPIYVESLKRVARDVATLRSYNVTTHVTVGNYVATLAPDDILRHYVQFDSVVRGEGEATVCDLLSSLRGEREIDNVAGLSYRKDGEVRHNTSRTNVQDINTLPFPARDSLPLVLEAENAPLVYTSRGCNARCEFCSVYRYYTASPNGVWRGRSPTNVVDEMESLYQQYGVRQFAFADEQFMGHGTSGRERALGIAQELLRRNLHFDWYFETRSSDVDRETFSVLRDAGLHAVFMGIESGYDPALKALHKGLLVCQHRKALAILRELEIIASTGFIMWRPETTFEELHANLDFLEDVGTAEITALATKLIIYPGTALEITLRAQNKLVGKFPFYDWRFDDPLIYTCFSIVAASSDALSTAYNSFARLRRSGLLRFDECIELQRILTGRFIAVVRDLAAEIRDGASSAILRDVYRARFVATCDELLDIINFTRMIVANHPTNGVALRSPMYLC